MINILGDTSQRHYLRKGRQLWKLCEDTEDHASCQNYTKRKYLHNQEFEEICQESNASCKSLYMPGETNFNINGKSVLIEGGIKSLDPPCLDKTSPFGPHPYSVMYAGIKELI